MADEENQTVSDPAPAPEAQPTTVSTPAPAEPKTFTQEEVNRLMAKTREETRQRTLKESKAQSQQPAPPPPAQTEEQSERLSMKELKAQLDEMKRRNDFNEGTRGLNLDPELVGDLYDLYKAQNPGNDPNWFATKAKLFAKTPTPSPAPTATQAASPADAAQPRPAAAPTAPNPTPNNPTVNGGLVDLFNLTPEQLARFSPADLRREYEKIMTIGTQMSGAPQRPKAPQR